MGVVLVLPERFFLPASPACFTAWVVDTLVDEAWHRTYPGRILFCFLRAAGDLRVDTGSSTSAFWMGLDLGLGLILCGIVYV